jgi:hypothetical protein
MDAPPADRIARLCGEIIWRHKGRADPISVAELMARTGVRTPREMKGIAAALVTEHGVMVGSIRGAKGDDFGGYFVVQDAADLEAACGPFEAQIETMQKRVKRLRQLALDRGIR